MLRRLRITNIFKYSTLLIVSIVSILGVVFSFGNNTAIETNTQRLATLVPSGDSCTDYGIISANQNPNLDIFVNCGGFLP